MAESPQDAIFEGKTRKGHSIFEREELILLLSLPTKKHHLFYKSQRFFFFPKSRSLNVA